MELSEYFDAVIMLTWSDWKKEPRSNRYHYATRFAREVPVLFVEPWAAPGESLTSETTEVKQLEIVHTSNLLRSSDVDDFLELLRSRGIRKPLIWIYNTLHYSTLIDAIPDAFRAYHATEDYLTNSKGWAVSNDIVADSVVKVLSKIDLVVAVSDGVLHSIRTKGQYSGNAIVAENGCDAQFLFDIADNAVPALPNARGDVAIYQGGINKRLDYDLLCGLADRLPTWEFWFCGAINDSAAEWEKLAKRKNVRYFGNLPPERVAELMLEATVGLIPFIQDQWIRNSLPLKAYEYVAVGLPVVTVPIAALQRDERVFTFAQSTEEFAEAMCELVKTRLDPDMQNCRRAAASRSSYDARYQVVRQRLMDEKRKVAASPINEQLNTLILYCDDSAHVGAIREHLEAFKKYSRNNIFFLPVTEDLISDNGPLKKQVDLSLFDVVIVHFSVRVSVKHHFNEGIAARLSRYRGLKILFIQDEYDFTEIARAWIERLAFDVVYTCVPASGREAVYPYDRFPHTEFLPTLTGYVAEDDSLDQYCRPIEDRAHLIGYRGRRLPAIYGNLGNEKYRIGVDVRQLAERRGLNVDIEVADEKRIYGVDWYKFLGSVRATLGTESGSNVFDFDGSLHAAISELQTESPDISFEEIHAKVLAPHENLIRMNQVSPKIFEAIRLGTALVLFEGEYSGVVRPHEHFIPLKKDYSNIDEVFDKLSDISFLKSLTARAYKDVIASGAYSYESFVRGVDDDIARRVKRRRCFDLFAVPALARGADGCVRNVLPTHPLGFSLNTSILGGDFKRQQMVEEIAVSISNLVDQEVARALKRELALQPLPSLRYLLARKLWRRTPESIRHIARQRVAQALEGARGGAGANSIKFRLVKLGWNLLPHFVRRPVLKLVNRASHNCN